MDKLIALDFTRWDMLFLYLLPALINFVLFVYTIFFLPQNRTNFNFSIFVLFVGFWQMSEGCMRLSISAETSQMWYHVMGLAATFVIPLGMQFALSYYNLHKKVPHWLIMATQFLPASIITILMVSGINQYSLVESEKWYWLVNPIPSTVTNFIYLWISVNGLLVLSLLINRWYVLPSRTQLRSQSLLLAIGFASPFIGGIIGEAIVPFFLKGDVVPITTPLFTVFSVASILAIKKYNMFDYSPKHHWEHIVKSINEGILILNNENQIMYANHNLCETLGYDFHKLYGKNNSILFYDQSVQNSEIDLLIELNNSKAGIQTEFSLKTAKGEKIWMMMGCVPYTDSKGNSLGTLCICTNIDRLKRAEKVIKDEKDRLNMAIEVGKMISYDIDFGKNIVEYSKNANDLLGLDYYSAPIRDIVNKFIVDEDKEKVTNSMMNLKLYGKIDYLQFRFRRPDNGKIIYLERRGELLKDDKGGNIGFRGVLIDITGVKEKEIELQQNEERLKAIFENEPECVMVLDVNGKLTDINPAGLETLAAKTIDDIPQQCVLSLILEEDKEVFKSLHATVLSGNPSTADFRLRSGDSIRWLESNAVPLRNEKGEVVSVLTVSRDITDYKAKADEIISINKKLEKSEQRLIEAQDMAQIGNWEIDFLNRTSKWSEQAALIFGVNLEDSNVRGEDWFEFVHPDDKNLVTDAVEKSMSDFSRFSIEHRLMRNDGSIRYVNTEGRYEFDEKGDAVGIVGVVHDITERKQYEINLQNLLQITNDQNKRLQDFAYIISHKVRSHSANISGILALMDIAKDNAEFIMLQKSADRLAETLENVNEIITFQKHSSE